jgi:predicted GIY-YIG superfamily endonuclease
MTENQSVHIYILRLRSPPGEPPRYYVGSAVDYEDRVRAHFAGAGAAFTKKYPPVELVEVRAGDRYDEEAATRRLMAERGIEFVRGGAYTRVQLPPEDVFTLQHEIWAAAGRCTNCGRDNHFVATCLAPLKQVPSPTALAPAVPRATHAAPPAPAPAAPAAQAPAAPQTPAAQAPAAPHELKINLINENKLNPGCSRCGRKGHEADKCYTKTENINCENCGRRGHRAASCYSSAPAGPSRRCHRCGYTGHARPFCRYIYDTDGELIVSADKYAAAGAAAGAAASAAVGAVAGAAATALAAERATRALQAHALRQMPQAHLPHLQPRAAPGPWVNPFRVLAELNPEEQASQDSDD